MSIAIQGLSCAACKQAIPADGVTCGACSAPHHWPCFAGSGHCASCQNAKAPLPFGVAPLRSGTSALALFAAVVSLVAIGVTVVALPARAPVVQVAAERSDPPRPRIARPMEPVHLPPVSPPIPVMILPSVPPAPAAPAPLEPQWRATSKSRNESSMTRAPGRMNGFMNPGLLGDRPGDELRIVFDEVPVRTVFVQAEARPRVGAPTPLMLKAEGRRIGATKESWVPLGAHKLPPAGRRWFRLEAANRESFDLVRLTLEGTGATVNVQSFTGLEAQAPLGEAAECARACLVKRIEGDFAVLVSEKGLEARVPRAVLSARWIEGGATLGSPGGEIVVKLSRDGSVSVYDPRSNGMRSWGTQLSALGNVKRSNVLVENDELGTAWLNGVGAWSLLDRWQPPVVREIVYNAALETSAVLNEDGTVSVYQPQNNMGAQVTEFDNLDEVDAAALWFETGNGPISDFSARRQLARMRGGALGLQLRGGDTQSRSTRELARWLRQDVAEPFRKLVKSAHALAAGDRVWIGWRSSLQTFDNAGSLNVTMLDRDSIFLRSTERGEASVPEFELHRTFLPAVPAARVGQTLWFEPEMPR